MVHGMRMAMGEKWAIFGAQCDRNADCRGGVFAVFAKIPPPTPHTEPHHTHPPHPIHHARKSPARFTLRGDPPLPVPFLSLPLPKIHHDA